MAIGLMFIAMWCIVSLAYIVNGIELPPTFIYMRQPHMEFSSGYSSYSLSFLIDLLHVIVIGMIVLAIIGGIMYRKFAVKNLLGGIVAFMITAAVMYGILSVDVQLSFSQNQSTGFGNSTGGNFSEPPQTWKVSPISILISVVVALVIVAIIYMYVKREYYEELGIPGEIEAMRKAVDKSLRKLKEEDDVRLGIISAYREMMKVLENRRIYDKPYLTPREFENYVLEKLRAVESKPYIQKLTELYEIAIYSRKELSESHRKEAVIALEGFKKNLKDKS